MFGMGFWEIVMIVIVAIVVIGPKDLPKVLRRLGQYAGKLRRMAADLRAQSGIDDALRMEGLSDDINEIRKLARGELDGVQQAIQRTPEDRAQYEEEMKQLDASLFRAREYPRDGADGYGAIPDAAAIDYELPPSPLARDPLYVTGDVDGVLPELPAPVVATDPGEPAAPPAETASTAEATADTPSEASSEKPPASQDEPPAETPAESADARTSIHEPGS